MCKRMMLVCLGLSLVLAFAKPAPADLVGHWAFDDGAGSVALDSSGYGHDAVVEGGGDAAWVEGQLGNAVEVGNGVWVNVPPEVWAPIDNQFTVAYWSFGYDGLANNWGFFATAAGANRMISNHLPWGDGSVYYDTADAAGAWNAERISQALDPGLATGVWNHWAFTKNADTGDKKVYLNGEVWLTGTNATGPVTEITVFTIGSGANGAEQYLGMIDDFQLHDVELTQEEIQAAMRGVSRELASGPTPEDAKIDVLRDVILSWTPGELAAKHDLYLGTVFTDVNEASAANDLGVLVSQGQADTSYDAGILEFGQTYYWRVDEVNSAPDNTVFKGDVWIFTAEPYSIQIPGDTIAVTASSSSNEFSMAIKAIDGSGLGADDTHAISPEAMWFTGTVDLDPWIQFEFDAVQQLDTMKVWNSNGAAEM
ncbi:MAG: LamG domain-containing protein, partial [Phycisphaeraceae bacterium]|nr:LamG domain-containing protein [Phycisphaeraceae bacterium]